MLFILKGLRDNEQDKTRKNPAAEFSVLCPVNCHVLVFIMSCLALCCLVWEEIAG